MHQKSNSRYGTRPGAITAAVDKSLAGTPNNRADRGLRRFDRDHGLHGLQSLEAIRDRLA